MHLTDGRAGIDAALVRRLGDELAARLPTNASYPPVIAKEYRWLPVPISGWAELEPRPYGYRLLFDAQRTSRQARRGATRREIWLDAGRHGQRAGRLAGAGGTFWPVLADPVSRFVAERTGSRVLSGGADTDNS